MVFLHEAFKAGVRTSQYFIASNFFPCRRDQVSPAWTDSSSGYQDDQNPILDPNALGS